MRALNEDEVLVMLPPYVEPEHRPILEFAEKCLADYEQSLLTQIKTEFDRMYSMTPNPEHIKDMEREFYDDPMRRCLINRLMEIKTICEKPRMMIKASNKW